MSKQALAALHAAGSGMLALVVAAGAQAAGQLIAGVPAGPLDWRVEVVAFLAFFLVDLVRALPLYQQLPAPTQAQLEDAMQSAVPIVLASVERVVAQRLAAHAGQTTITTGAPVEVVPSPLVPQPPAPPDPPRG